MQEVTDEEHEVDAKYINGRGCKRHTFGEGSAQPQAETDAEMQP